MNLSFSICSGFDGFVIIFESVPIARALLSPLNLQVQNMQQIAIQSLTWKSLIGIYLEITSYLSGMSGLLPMSLAAG